MTEFEKNKIRESRLISSKDNNIDFNSTIYRIIPIDRLLDFLSVKKFSMARPAKWEDPFENLLLKSDFWINNIPLSVKTIRESYFGVCWTLTKENDAMWRIYSQDKRGVKIKTNIGKIFNQLYDKLTLSEKLDIIVGAVEYDEQNKVSEYLKTFGEKDFIDSDNKIIPSTLLLKRNEFKIEDEVRFLYCKANHNNDFFTFFDFNWLEVIEGIEFDPRIDLSIFDSYRKLISKSFGIDEQLIKLSELYKPLSLNINIL